MPKAYGLSTLRPYPATVVTSWGFVDCARRNVERARQNEQLRQANALERRLRCEGLSSEMLGVSLPLSEAVPHTPHGPPGCPPR